MSANFLLTFDFSGLIIYFVVSKDTKFCKNIKEITERLHLLPDNECLGVSVREMFGVDTDYRYVFVAHQYVFYRVDEECVYVVNMYHEREDFMQKLFRIGNSSQALD